MWAWAGLGLGGELACTFPGANHKAARSVGRGHWVPRGPVRTGLSDHRSGLRVLEACAASRKARPGDGADYFFSGRWMFLQALLVDDSCVCCDRSGRGRSRLTGWLGASFKSPVAPSEESKMRAFRGEDCSLGHLPCCPAACRAASCPWLLGPGTGTLHVVAGSRPVSGTPLISLHCPRVQTDKRVSRSPPCMCSQRFCACPGLLVAVGSDSEGVVVRLCLGTSFGIYVRETCSHRILLLPTLSC